MAAMARSSSSARSISQVSQESLAVELRGSVQTIFPIHACMPQTANGETQDYGTLGDDGPLEGATKVFQVTLRDLAGGLGGLHRINAYFYDDWADMYHSDLHAGDEIAVSGPAARLVRPDPSSGSGDHPFCLVFHCDAEGDDDEVTGTDLAGNAGAGQAGGGITCTVVTSAGQVSRGGPAGRGQRRRAGAGLRGGAAGRSAPGPRQDNASYLYSSLGSLEAPGNGSPPKQLHVYGIVSSFNHPRRSRGTDWTATVNIIDESCPLVDNAISCNLFHPSRSGLPVPVMVGDIIRLHRVKVSEYRGRPQLVGVKKVFSWLLVRNRRTHREAFQRGMAGGGLGSEDPCPEEDLPLSGPDAGGGGGNDAVLPSAEWEVLSSSRHYSMSRTDFDRCTALHAWLENNARHLWLKPSSEPKTWVQDAFRRPMSGPIISETEVDLVCCLLSKHESEGGGAGSLSNIFVADGTGFSSSPPNGLLDRRCQAALLKGMRTALGNPNWSPGNPPPPPFPAHLHVEVMANVTEWEALAMSPGMWIRLKKLTIIRNRNTGNLKAWMKENTSSVNPLHPSMAEVQAIATAYSAHCAGNSGSESTKSNGGHSNSKSNGDANSDSNKPLPPTNDANKQPPSFSGSSSSAPSAVNRETDTTAPSSRNKSGQSTSNGGLQNPQAARGWQPLRSSPVPNGSPTEGQGEPARANGVDENGRLTADTSERRGVKRDLPQLNEAGLPMEETAPTRDGQLSDLGLVKRMIAPSEFSTRVRIVAHFPREVEGFVRQGPSREDRPMFLFTLRLGDDHGILDALVSGEDISHLLPGAPPPAQFQSSEDARNMVIRGLIRHESKSGPCLELRLRSYLTPIAGGGRRTSGPNVCKRYQILAPSSL